MLAYFAAEMIRVAPASWWFDFSEDHEETSEVARFRNELPLQLRSYFHLVSVLGFWVTLKQFQPLFFRTGLYGTFIVRFRAQITRPARVQLSRH